MARRLLVALALVGGMAVVPSSPAGATAVCTANVSFGYAPGITLVPGPPIGVTGTLVLNCPALSPDAGLWILPFAGGPVPESCFGLPGGFMTLGPGAVGPPGAVAGTFTYAHAYAGSAFVLGTITWLGNTRGLEVVGEWLPVLVPGDCVVTPVTSGFLTGAGALT